MLPRQNLPQSKKNKKWIEDYLVAIKDMAMVSSMSKQRDLTCWNMYHEKYNESDYDYLRKVGQYEYPARVRWIGIQRAKINLLVSQQARRPWVFSTSAIDRRSKEKKYKEKIKAYVKQIDQNLKLKYFRTIAGMQSIEQKRSQITQQLQQEPQNQEQAQQQALMREQMPVIDSQLNLVKDMLSEEQAITKKQIQTIENYYRYDYMDFAEEIAQAGTKKLRRDLNIEKKSVQNFISQCVTGKQYWYVDYIPGEQLPRLEILEETRVYFPSSATTEWTQDGDWVAIESMMSYNQVMDEWGHKLDSKQKDSLETYRPRGENNGYFVSQMNNKAVFSDEGSNYLYSGSGYNSGNIKVWKIWYKCQRKIQAKKSPNPHQKGKYFTHFIDMYKDVIDETDYKYKSSDKSFVNKKNGSVVYQNEVERYNSKKGEYIETRYAFDRYKGVLIGNDIKLGELDQVQLRSVDHYSQIVLPVVGRTFSNMTQKPYSLIWATKDLQQLYNIITYHRELMLAVSGVKGSIMDLSQKPADMSEEEWLYQKKMGTMWIETVKKGVSRITNSTFNQFKSYDDTVSPAISYLDNMLNSLDETMGSIIGVPRQRQGAVISTDQVGTFQQSIQQANLVTEILYNDHDEIERRAVSMALNLCAKYCWDKGDLLEIPDHDLGKDYKRIPPDLMNYIDWEIYLANNTREEQSMTELKQLMIKQNDKGELSFSQLLSLYNMETLKGLEMKSKYFAEQAEELMQENAGAITRSEAENEQAKIRLKGEMDAVIQQQKKEIEGIKIQLDQTRLQFDERKHDDEIELKNRELEQNKNINLMKIASEREVEGAYLHEQSRASRVQETLQSLELQLEALLSKDSNDNDKEKLSLERKKSSAKVKEHIID